MKGLPTDNIKNFEDCVIIVDDMGENFNSNIEHYFATGRHEIQLIVMCH